MHLRDTVKGKACELRLFQDNHGRWHWKMYSMGWEICNSRPEGYGSKQGAKQSLIAIQNAIRKLRGA